METAKTLSCRTGGKNITTDNVTVRHLLDVQRIARRRVNPKFSGLNGRPFYDEKVGAAEIEKLFHRNT